LYYNYSTSKENIILTASRHTAYVARQLGKLLTVELSDWLAFST